MLYSLASIATSPEEQASPPVIRWPTKAILRIDYKPGLMLGRAPIFQALHWGKVYGKVGSMSRESIKKSLLTNKNVCSILEAK